MSIKVEQVQPTLITNEDISWLVLGCARSIDGVQAVDLVSSALAGGSGIYRMSGDVQGVFVLTRLGDRAEITSIAGKGLLKYFSDVHELILATAAGMGFKSVAGYVARPGLAKAYKTQTKARFAEYFIEDIL